MRPSTTRSSAASDPSRRHVESSALTAILPLLAAVPVWLVALAVWWLPVHLLWPVPFGAFALAYLALGLVLFIRPVQVRLLALLVGARRPTADEQATLDTAWRSVLQANHLPRHRYTVARPARPTTSTPSPAAATSSSSPATRSTSCPATSSPACSPTS